MGHVHLRVAEIPATAGFYCDALGFALMAAFGAQAAFMSAGGYHHHVGANTWESRGAGPAPPGHATLERATVVLPTAGDVDRLAHEGELLGQGAQPLGDGRGVVVRAPSGTPVARTAAGGAGLGCRAAEQPRVVRHDPGDAEALELGDPLGVVD